MQWHYPASPLEAGQVRLRPWRDTDLACVEAAARDPALRTGTTLPAVFTPDTGVAFLQRQRSRLTGGEGISQAIADTLTDEALGLVYLARRPQAWVAGLGYWLVPEARGHNRASTAVRLLSDWALAELDLRRLEAWVDPTNLASQRVVAAAGFLREGLLRNYLCFDDHVTDAVVFSRIG